MVRINDLLQHSPFLKSRRGSLFSLQSLKYVLGQALGVHCVSSKNIESPLSVRLKILPTTSVPNATSRVKGSCMRPDE